MTTSAMPDPPTDFTFADGSNAGRPSALADAVAGVPDRLEELLRRLREGEVGRWLRSAGYEPLAADLERLVGEAAHDDLDDLATAVLARLHAVSIADEDPATWAVDASTDPFLPEEWGSDTAPAEPNEAEDVLPSSEELLELQRTLIDTFLTMEARRRDAEAASDTAAAAKRARVTSEAAAARKQLDAERSVVLAAQKKAEEALRSVVVDPIPPPPSVTLPRSADAAAELHSATSRAATAADEIVGSVKALAAWEREQLRLEEQRRRQREEELRNQQKEEHRRQQEEHRRQREEERRRKQEEEQRRQQELERRWKRRTRLVVTAFFLALIVVVGALAISEGSWRDSAGATDPTLVDTLTTDTMSLAGPTIAPGDLEVLGFLRMMNVFDSATSALAVRKGSDDSVIQLGGQLEAYHGTANRELAQLAAGLGAAAEPTASSRSLAQDAQQTLDYLNGLSGDEFDRAFVEERFSHYQQVADLIDSRLLQSAQHPQVHGLLSATRSELTNHLVLLDDARNRLARTEEIAEGSENSVPLSGSASARDDGNLSQMLMQSREDLAVGRLQADRGEYAEATGLLRRALQRLSGASTALRDNPALVALQAELRSTLDKTMGACRAERMVAEQRGTAAPACQ